MARRLMSSRSTDAGWCFTSRIGYVLCEASRLCDLPAHKQQASEAPLSVAAKRQELKGSQSGICRASLGMSNLEGKLLLCFLAAATHKAWCETYMQTVLRHVAVPCGIRNY